MGKTYRQFCPVAKAAEIIAERWTPLIVRELLAGSRRFNDIRRGVPSMSPSLLSQRLTLLEESGVIERSSDDSMGGGEYHLTAAGRELQPVVEALGIWGKRWVRREVQADDMDPGLLMWDIHRRLRIERFPAHRTVLRFELVDVPSKRRFYWLIIDQGRVDICLKHPGFDTDLYVAVTLEALTAVWLGDLPLERALREGRVVLHGPSELVEGFRSWLALSVFANVERRNA